MHAAEQDAHAPIPGESLNNEQRPVSGQSSDRLVSLFPQEIEFVIPQIRYVALREHPYRKSIAVSSLAKRNALWERSVDQHGVQWKFGPASRKSSIGGRYARPTD
jgi:hypothetical protein